MAGDVVGVAEVTDLFAFGRYGQRCDSDIQRAVRNPVQQTLKVPLLKFERQVQRGGNLPPEINADPRPGALTILHCKWGHLPRPNDQRPTGHDLSLRFNGDASQNHYQYL